MIPSARTAALRSTALATSLVLPSGCRRWLRMAAWAKVPMPKPRPIARNVVPKSHAARYAARVPKRPGIRAAETARPGRPSGAPHWRRRRDSMPRCRRRRARKPPYPAAVAATSSTPQADKDALENVIELDPQAQACRRDAGWKRRFRIRSRASSRNG